MTYNIHAHLFLVMLLLQSEHIYCSHHCSLQYTLQWPGHTR